MPALPTAPADDFRTGVRTFLAEASPSAEVRRVMETDLGYDPVVWKGMAAAGLVGRHVDARHGGGGGDMVDMGVLMEETGSVLACVPMLSTVMATAALEASGDTGLGDELLPAIAGGRLLAAFAVTGDTARWDAGSVAVEAVPEVGGKESAGGSWHLDGHASYVVDGHSADVVIVAATSGPATEAGRGVSLFLVEAGARGFERQLLETVDRTRRLARLSFDATPARLLGAPGKGWAVASHTLDVAAAALASEQAGGAGRCLEMSVAHAGARHQFGRPIGSFQAVAHRCAEMLLEVESARAAAREACRVAASSPGDLPTRASMAKACCSDAFAWVATETIQVHGGVGFTWDHDVHLYFKRAKSSRLLFGDPRHHRELLARRLGF